MIKSRRPGHAFPSRKRKESLEKGQKNKKDFSEKKINKKKDPSAHKSLMIRNSLGIDSYRKHTTWLSETSWEEEDGLAGNSWQWAPGAHHSVCVFSAISLSCYTHNRQMRRVASVEEFSGSYVLAIARVPHTPHLIWSSGWSIVLL